MKEYEVKTTINLTVRIDAVSKLHAVSQIMKFLEISGVESTEISVTGVEVLNN